MPDEQWASTDGGPEMMLGDVESMRPWTAQNGPVDEYEYVEFVERFGESALTPEGKLKRPGEFSDPVFGQAAKVVYETGSLPREMRRAVAQRRHELGMLPAGGGGQGQPRAAGGQYQPGLLDRAEDWYMEGMGGASEVVDDVLLGGATKHYGDTAGRHDAGQASDWDLVKAGGNWGGRVAANAYAGGQGVRALNRATAMSGPVTHYGPKGMTGIRPGDWVITGKPGPVNRVLSLKPTYPSSVSMNAPPGTLQIPRDGYGWLHRILGHRIYTP